MELETSKKWGINLIAGLFAVALALLLVLVLRSIAVQITPPPSFETEPYPDVSSEELCEREGGRWVTRKQDINTERPVPVVEGEKLEPFCQGQLDFERERNQQREASEQTSLFVFAIGGGLAVIIALFLQGARGVAPGLMLGGIVAFFIAGISVWQLSPGLGRLATIAIVFVVLVITGLKVFGDKSK